MRNDFAHILSQHTREYASTETRRLDCNAQCFAHICLYSDQLPNLERRQLGIRRQRFEEFRVRPRTGGRLQIGAILGDLGDVLKHCLIDNARALGRVCLQTTALRV